MWAVSPSRSAQLSRDRRRPRTAPRRLLSISHPAVVNVNQEVYRELKRRGWEVTILLPTAGAASTPAHDDARKRLRAWRAVASDAGRAAGTSPAALLSGTLRRVVHRSTHVAFIEAEPFAFSAAQWGRVFSRLDIPFGVHSPRTSIERCRPRCADALPGAEARGLVAARSDTAARLARVWGASGEIGLPPHGRPRVGERVNRPGAASFTVGYAGSLVASKGLGDLLAAVRALEAPVELLLIGDGELRRSSRVGRSRARRCAC